MKIPLKILKCWSEDLIREGDPVYLDRKNQAHPVLIISGLQVRLQYVYNFKIFSYRVTGHVMWPIHFDWPGICRSNRLAYFKTTKRDSMKTDKLKLYDLVDLTDPQKVLDEIKYITSLMTDDFDFDRFELFFKNTTRLFNGEYPGYQKSKTKYHDLEHTNAVVLATARLMHGCFIDGEAFTPHTIFLGLAANLFHDTGLIQTDNDIKGTGAKYTVGHEERSIIFMKEYLSSRNFSSKDIKDCSHLIQCTILSLPVKEIPFRSTTTEILGKIVGSADLLAQIADRNYLEKLFLLFQEFEEANIPDFGSALELLHKTEDFYKFVAQKRLSEELGNISASMRHHFKTRWDIDRDLYEESISKNIEYLKFVINDCEDSFNCYLEKLRRLDISKKIDL